MFIDPSTRLNKYISESGICSRREADRYIEQGNVFINGKRAKVGDKVSPGDEVKVNGQSIEPQDAEDFIFIALNKPVGVVSTTESSERNNIVDFINHGARIFPIGRLDKDSQGLIFLTSNGDLVNKILRAGNQHEKEYLVTVNKPITDSFISGMSAGVPMLGVTTKKCTVTKVSPLVFKITLVQGLNRQIRRMCEHFNYDVRKLERVRIMNISLKGLPVGEWRDLNEKELTAMLKAVENSSSEAATAPKKARKPSQSRRSTGSGHSERSARSNTSSGSGRSGKSAGSSKSTRSSGSAKSAKSTGSSKSTRASGSAKSAKPTGSSKSTRSSGSANSTKSSTANPSRRHKPKPASNTKGKPQRLGKKKLGF